MWTDYLYVPLQAAFLSVVMVLAPLALLSGVKIFARLGPALKIAFSIILSSLLVALAGTVALHTGGYRYVSLALGLLSAGIVVARIGLLRDFLRSMSARERGLLGVAGGFGLLWLFCLPWLNCGAHYSLLWFDAPNYYIAAQNILSGKGFVLNYFSGGSATASLTYLFSTPIAVHVTAFVMAVAGHNWYPLYIYSLLCGVAALFLALHYALSLDSDKSLSFSDYAVAAALCLVPYYFVWLGVGLYTWPGALAFTALGVAYITVRDRISSFAVCLAACVFLIFYRPECTVLAVVFVSMLALSLFFRKASVKIGRPAAAICVAILVFSAAASLFLFAEKTNAPVFRNMSFYYTGYNPVSRSFELIYNQPREINEHIIRMNYGSISASYPPYNTAVMSEIRAHPAAFAVGILKGTGNLCALLLKSSFLPEKWPLENWPWLTVTLVLVWLGIASIRAEHRLFVVTGIVFLYGVLFINTSITTRHVLTLTPLYMAFLLKLPAARVDSLGNFLDTRKRSVALVAGAFILWYDVSSFYGLKKVIVRTNRDILPICMETAKAAGPDGVTLMGYPALMTAITGLYSASNRGIMLETLDPMISKFRPDAVAFFDKDYNDMVSSYSLSLPGYYPWSVNYDRQYAVLKSASKLSAMPPNARVAAAGTHKEARIYYEDGKSVEFYGEYNLDGLADGEMKEFYPGGRVKWSAGFRNGLLDGPAEIYYSSGKIRSRVIYSAGRREGKAASYYSDGTLKSEVPYVSGMADGKVKEYYRGGTIKAELDFVKGYPAGDASSFHENGRTAEHGYFRNGRLAGRFEAFDRTGRVCADAEYWSGRHQRPVRFYSPDGALAALMSPEGDRVYRFTSLARDGKTPLYSRRLLETDAFRLENYKLPL